MVNRQLAPSVALSLRGRWEPVYRSRLHYLVTWSTRGRKPVFKERHATTLESLIPAICDDREFPLANVAVGRDHVHLILALRPTQSVASAVREIKGRASIELLQQHPELRVWLGGNLVWDERYAVETVSPARLEKVQARLRAAHHPDRDGFDRLARAS